MAEQKRLAYAIVRFLHEQLRGGGMSPDAQESLEGRWGGAPAPCSPLLPGVGTRGNPGLGACSLTPLVAAPCPVLPPVSRLAPGLEVFLRGGVAGALGVLVPRLVTSFRRRSA